jgi:hypothetical protein
MLKDARRDKQTQTPHNDHYPCENGLITRDSARLLRKKATWQQKASAEEKVR